MLRAETGEWSTARLRSPDPWPHVTQQRGDRQLTDRLLYVGCQLEEIVERVDRDVKKPHENPAIGVLLCASKDDEVVEYALSRSLSPALIAEYQTQLPDKLLLQAKLHEFYQLDVADRGDEA